MQFYADGFAEIGFALPLALALKELVPDVETQEFALSLSLEQVRMAQVERDAFRTVIGRQKKQAHHVIAYGRAQALTRVDRSSIHGHGLFAARDIAQNAQIIEYQGQRIDSLLNDLVEETYQKNGFESTYMFRMGTTPHVIDATFVGNGARFANHSCSPNACSKLVGNKVYLVALRDINVGEEIVYNYNMRRIPGLPRVDCYCGQPDCKGFMDVAV